MAALADDREGRVTGCQIAIHHSIHIIGYADVELRKLIRAGAKAADEMATDLSDSFFD
jgi:hypothetical protein